ncbi:MAG: hypothetical protein JW803_00835 [Endomicrobiales bacterium]|nr:hypothetical protein [Endomicrobiales bacterium]
MSGIKKLAVILCIVLLGGCAQRVLVNPNADLGAVKRIAVLPSRPEPLYSVIAAMWEADLLSVGYEVVDRTSIESILKETKFSASGMTQEQSVELGKLSAVDGILFVDEVPAAYGDNGKGHIVDVATGRIICTIQLKYKDILAKVMKKPLKKSGWKNFYRSYKAGGTSGPLLVRFPSFDQQSIKKVAISPTSKYDLTNQLIKVGYDPIERKAFENILAEQKLSISGLLNQEEMEKIGKLYGIDGMVFSGFYEIPEYGRFYYAKMVHIESGRVVWSVARLSGFLEEFEFTPKLIKRAMQGKQE